MKRKRGFVKQLAKECGCSPEHLSNVLNGHRPVSKKLARKLSEATGKPVMELLYDNKAA